MPAITAKLQTAIIIFFQCTARRMSITIVQITALGRGLGEGRRGAWNDGGRGETEGRLEKGKMEGTGK